MKSAWSFRRLKRCGYRERKRSREVERAAFGKFWVAEGGDFMTVAARQGDPEAVVRDLFHFNRAAHFEVRAVADHDEGDVIERVRIPFPEFVCPNDRGIVQHGAFATGLGSIGETPGKVRQLFREPGV